MAENDRGSAIKDIVMPLLANSQVHSEPSASRHIIPYK
jgi:hypothetical protein